jgi:acyl-CoA hydrolase
MGARGASSTSHFWLWGEDGASIDSGVALDTNYHTHLVYSDGSNIGYSIDGAAPVVHTGKHGITVACEWFAHAQETASRTVNCDMCFMLVGLKIP